jgi:2-polyprenyl-3-methyl-5-hydroxy-6-metoxy-1,4-benzoquinol methylase
VTARGLAGHWTACRADYQAAVRACAAETFVRSVCDVGGGANPTLDLDAIRACDVRYTLLDVSAEELAKAPSGYRTVCADITDPTVLAGEQFDLVCTKTVAEHITDPRAFHRRVFELLSPGGVAIHVFPTLWALPYVVNRVLPGVVAERILVRVQEGREPEGSEGKFRAYYRWCRGPTAGQRERFERLGYEVRRYSGYFGHDYYRKLPALDRLEERKTAHLIERPRPRLTSFALVVLRKPRTAA